MNLLDELRVDAAYTRSINLERDWESDSTAELRSYMPTPRACEALERFLAVQQPSDHPRAWALIGPYGSGKSAFALFLAKLLSRPGSAGAVSALRMLKSADPRLARDVKRLTKDGQGYCAILLTGSPEPLAKRFLMALEHAATQFWSGRKGRPPEVIRRIRVALELEEFGGTELIELVCELQAAVKRAGGQGVLVVIDELGKFLEYEARHRDATDIYLLQMLAESAQKGGAAPLNVLVLLHQAFEQYAVGFSTQLKNEWKKVQGRFEGIPFIESSEQVMRLIGSAIRVSVDAATRQRTREQIERIGHRMLELGALPGAMSEASTHELFEASYPLHPASLVLLPSLAQKVAQNERTIFSYLGGHEPHGFLDTVSRLVKTKTAQPWVMPYHIFDYFVASQAGLLTDPLTHRRWAEVVTALERLGDAPPLEVELLKTIGLFNLAGVQGGLKASPEILQLCFEHNPDELTAAFAVLQQRSVITYQKFSGEYRVWQGSDFDIEEALSRERSQMGEISLSDVLNHRHALGPLVARRYSIETGTLRYFTPCFVDRETRLDQSAIQQPTLFVCMAFDPDEATYFQGLAKDWDNSLAVFVLRTDAAEVNDAVAEVMAIERVQRTSPQLSTDPVAQREVRERLVMARRREARLLTNVLDEPADGSWYHCGQEQQIPDSRALQKLLSDALIRAYPLAPTIHNELLNRDRPSSSANAGRNKLVQAMLERPNEELLGIDRFPAEKAMYLSLLLSTGIHQPGVNGWGFGRPNPESGARNNVDHVWSCMERFLDRTESEPLSVGKLFEELQAPPFGVKKGPLPIFFLAAYLAFREEIALYDEGLFVPFVNHEVFERLMRSPALFAVQRIQLGGMRDAVFKKYAEAITGETPQEAGLLDVVRPLARFMMTLPDYAKKTHSLSSEAQAVRDLFFDAKSPTELLLLSVPEACGFPRLVKGNGGPEELHAFGRKLSSVLVELRSAYHGLLQHVLKTVRQAFSLDATLELEEVRSRLHGRYAGLQEYTIDTQGLRAFLGRLTDAYGDDTQWLVSVASFLGRKPPEKWSDDDVRAAEYRLVEFARRTRDLERLRMAYEGNKQQDAGRFDVILLRTVRRGAGEAEDTIVIGEEMEGVVRPISEMIQRALDDKLPNHESRLAAIAQVLDFLLRSEVEATESPAHQIHVKEARHD